MKPRRVESAEFCDLCVIYIQLNKERIAHLDVVVDVVEDVKIMNKIWLITI